MDDIVSVNFADRRADLWKRRADRSWNTGATTRSTYESAKQDQWARRADLIRKARAALRPLDWPKDWPKR